ncbi:MAG TPA: Xaa-Pro peptidase family protein [Candidatus Binatia bacterium]|nr:Xaa-Pro peptidase family protein [Candidatus Binatia bacterium]
MNSNLNTDTLDRAAAATKPIPFDAKKLDALMDDAGIDLLLVTSKHNVQYLLGGYRFFFFDYMDALGTSRYLPIVLYRRGRPEDAAYIGYRLEAFEHELGKFWTPHVKTSTSGTLDAIAMAVEHIGKLGGGIARIGVEASFIPADADAALRKALPQCEIVEALFPLERLRAQKTPAELTLLRQASEKVIDSMLATFKAAAPGMTKLDLVDRLRREEVGRGLTFEYCLLTAGTSLNRAPSGQALKAGDIMSLDSGGNYRGYIGDLCRMGILGEPDAELQDLLGAIEAIQQAARKPIRRGARGGDIFVAAEALLQNSPHKGYVDFMAHGMGLITHEAPRLAQQRAYTGYDAERPLESNMVVSIETTMKHPRRGFIKLEDTVAVTGDGWQGFGDTARGWNRAGG